ncbi:hypothetical protein RI367_003871 [Sorochytrium milnesiophthora]
MVADGQASGAGGSSATLFEVSLPQKLTLDNVYMNGLHALRRFEIRNVCDEPIRVKLRSNLGSQIAYQLSNENLPEYEPKSVPASSGEPPAGATDKEHNKRLMSLRSSRESLLSSSLSSTSLSSYTQESLSGMVISQESDAPSSQTPQEPRQSQQQQQQSLSPLSMSQVTTNTATAASLGAFAFSDRGNNGQEFNQLFNFVNYIDEVTIAPGTSQAVILAFLADRHAPHKTSTSALGDSKSPTGLLTSGEEEEAHEFLNVQGLLLLYAYRQRKAADSGILGSTADYSASMPASPTLSPTSAAPPSWELTKEQAGDGKSLVRQESTDGWITVDRKANDAVRSRHPSVMSDFADVATTSNWERRQSPPNVGSLPMPLEGGELTFRGKRRSSLGGAIPEAITPTAQSFRSGTSNSVQVAAATTTTLPVRPENQLTIKFKARICKTVLWTDVAQTGMTFEDCVVGGTYFKDFTVWNRSEIDLYWVLNAVDLSTNSVGSDDGLRFTDYETSEPLSDISSKPIPGFSYRRIRVTFKPRSTGEFNYDVQLENANDAANVEVARLHAVVRSVLKEETLVISNAGSNSMLDFGECCAGVWSRQKLVLKNVSELPIEVRVSAENATVMFDTKGDEFFDRDDFATPSPAFRGFRGALTDSEHGSRRTSELDPKAPDGRRLGDRVSFNSAAATSTNTTASMGQPGQASRMGLGINGLTHSAKQSRDGTSDWSAPSSSSSSRSSSPESREQPSQGDLLDDSLGPQTPNLEDGGTTSDPESAAHVPPVRSASRASMYPDSPDFNEDESDSEADVSWVNLPQLVEGIQTSTEQREAGLDGAAALRDANALSPTRSLLEEIVIRPGVERTIVVSYRPDKDQSTADYRAGMLTRRIFRLNLVHAMHGSLEKEKKTIQCRARSCTSFVEVSPSIVDFGDTDIGTLKSAPIQISNRSELAARVQLLYDSKVLNCTREEIVIPPKQSVEVKIDIYPRKINPDYRKSITVVNWLNRDNDQTVEVRSTNIDKHRITFHSLFYRIWTPRSTNFIDFGTIMINNYAVRTFTIQNISRKAVVLELTSSLPEEVQILRRQARLATAITSPVPGQDASLAIKTNLLPRLSRDSGSHQSSPHSGSTEGAVSTSPRKGSSPFDSPAVRPSSKRDDALFERMSERRFHRKHGVASTYQRDRAFAKDTASLSSSNPFLSTSPFSPAAPVADTPSGSHPSTDSSAVDHADVKESAANGAGTNGDHSMHSLGPSDYLDLAMPKDGQRSPKRAVRSASTAPSRPSKLSSVLRSESPRQTSAGSSSGPRDDPSRDVEQFRNPFDNQSDVSEGSDDNIEADDADGEEQVRIASLVDSTRENLDALIAVLESLDHATLPAFTKALVEEKYVKLNMSVRKELDAAFRHGELVPVSEPIEIAPGCDQSIVLIFSPLSRLRPAIQGKPRKLDAKIRFRLLDFDRGVEEPSFESMLSAELAHIPVREFLLRSSICRSVMELGQRHINLGTLSRHEQKSKALVIRNRSEVPLLYVVKKTGSIASGDLVLDDSRMGVIRAHGTREVTFMFKPSMPGAFQEKLIVDNVQDRENQQVVTLKAHVRKPDSFQVEPTSLDFGACLINEGSTFPQQVVVQNVDKQMRMFELKYEAPEGGSPTAASGTAFVFEFDDADVVPAVALDADMEEQIESLEQKLKIATRKGRGDKVTKITERIAMLRRGERLDSAMADSAGAEMSASSLENLSQSGVLPQQARPDGTGEDTPSLTAETPAKLQPPLASPLPRSKRTDRSIMFAVGPGSSKRITIQLRAATVDLSSSNTADKAPENLNGCFSVYEQRNTDAVKQVTFSVILCYDHLSYMQRLQELQQVIPFMSNIDVRSEQSEAEARSEFVAAESDQTANATGADGGVDVVVEGGAVIDLGRIHIGSPAQCSFVLRNKSDRIRSYRIGFEARDTNGVIVRHKRLQINPRQGFLRGGGRQQVDLTLVTLTHGQHMLDMSPISFVARVPLSLAYTATYREYIAFPTDSIVSDCLDMGVCYADPDKRFAKVIRLPVRNITDVDIVLSVTTNLSQQMFMYEDASCEVAIGTSSLAQGATKDFFVALQPNVSSRPLLVGKRTVTTFEARDLIGGFKFSVFEQSKVATTAPSGTASSDSAGGAEPPRSASSPVSTSTPLAVQSLKFQALIGQSLFSVSSRFLNFGSTQTVGKTFRGSFTIFNLSNRLPLHYRVTTSSPAIVLGKSEGELDGTDVVLAEKHRRCREEISFDIQAMHVGYFFEHISVVNLHHPSQIIQVFVTLLVEEGSLRLDTREAQVAEVDSGDADNKLPLLRWSQVYVEEPEGGVDLKRAPSTQSYLQPVTFTNERAQDLVLVPESDVQLRVVSDAGQEADESESIAPTELPWRRCGAAFTVPATGSVTVQVDAPQCPAFTDDDKQHLRSFKSVKMRGILRLRDASTGRVVKVLELLCFFCISEAELLAPSIDLGAVGYINNWAEVPFRISVRNLSTVDAHFSIDDCPPGIRLSSGESLRLAVGATDTIGATLVPQQLAAKPGPVSLALILRNASNARNVLRQTLTMTLTECQLRFDRLDNGRLLLPPVQHPIIDQSLSNGVAGAAGNSNGGSSVGNGTGSGAPSLPNGVTLAASTDTWFTISNVSATDAHFEVSVLLNAEAASLIDVAVLSRFSNSPLKGVVSLSSKGSIEVRLRAGAKENSRLDAAALPLLGPNSAPMGQVRVTFTTPGQPEGGSMRETIDIHGSISEIPAFRVAEKHILFDSSLLSELDTSSPTEVAEPVTVGLMHIQNLLSFAPLHFRLHFEGSQELDLPQCFRIQGVDENLEGVAQPSENKTVEIELLDATIGLPSDLRLVVEDVQSLTQYAHSVQLLLTSSRASAQSQRQRQELLEQAQQDEDEERGAAVRDQTMERRSPPEDQLGHTMSPRLGDGRPGDVQAATGNDAGMRPPWLYLRGCKVAPDQVGEKLRFELDLGQQDIGDRPISRRIVLENRGYERLSYRIRTVAPEYDRSWLAISRTEGTLDESEGDQSHAVTITCTPSTRNVFSTYIFVENVDNPADCKSIRVSMEVVARQILRRNPNALSDNALVFDVFVNGVDLAQPLVRFQNVFYYNEYYSRSIVIVNRESVPLEFTLKSTLPASDNSELLFSTSRNIAKLFKSIIVDPDSQVRVYLRIRPVPGPSIDVNTVATPDGFVEEKSFEIVVNCRLVKDFQKNIAVVATCRWPQINVSQCNLMFSGCVDLASDKLSLEPDSHDVVIKNLFSTPLRVRMMSEAPFFAMDPAFSDVLVLDGGDSTTLRVRPNMAKLRQHMDLLAREKYFIEHIVLYSTERPAEKVSLILRLSFGYLQDFQFLLPRHSAVFSTLEASIALVLRELNQYASSLVQGASSQPGASSDVAVASRRLQEIQFQYVCTLDQLIFYATSSSTGENFYQLASLLFSVVRSSNIVQLCPDLGFSSGQAPWSSHSNMWIASLYYFLSFFPIRHPLLDALRQLYASAVQQVDRP